jgi:large subunit ribosomal protein L18
MKRIKGSPNRPRLAVFRSNRHFYAQVIDDQNSKTLFSLSTLDTSVRDLIKTGQNSESARIIGKKLAEALVKNNLVQVVLDRRFKPYHGRIEAFAQGARDGGLEF